MRNRAVKPFVNMNGNAPRFVIRYTGAMSRKARQFRVNFIAAWREFRGLRQEALAEMVGMSKGNLSRLENRKQGLTDESLLALSRALNCSMHDLLFIDPTVEGDPNVMKHAFEQLPIEDQRRLLRIQGVL